MQSYDLDRDFDKWQPWLTPLLVSLKPFHLSSCVCVCVQILSILKKKKVWRITNFFFLISKFITKCSSAYSWNKQLAHTPFPKKINRPNMIIIHTHITNPLYFLIIKLYRVILYFIIHAHIYTNNSVTKINKYITHAVSINTQSHK